MAKDFDLIVYGATGFTGEKITKEIAKAAPITSQFKWAIGARDQAKLDRLAAELTFDGGVSPPEVVVVDVQETEALEKALGRARLMQLTLPVDICGETEFIEEAYAQYNAQAIANRAAIVPACGYDSVPADIGTLFSKTTFEKEGSVATQTELFVSFGSGPSGVGVNATTFISAVLGFASVDNLRLLRKKTHRKINYSGPGLEVVQGPKWQPRVNAYTVPLAVADVPVVKLGQQIAENHKDSYAKGESFPNQYTPPDVLPVHFAGYFALSSWVSVAYIVYIGMLLSLASKWTAFRNALIQYPQYFTLGIFTFQGPSQQQLDESSFSQEFISRGFKNGAISSRPNREIITTIKGPEMGYVATPQCVIACATMLLSDKREKIPFGVLTPATAFSNVLDELIVLLAKGGIEFSVKSKRDL
ncbi:hypothetical protein HDU91_006842 [Kappamyces sp. JEL0680]|nr:hypothetical protein HDU91_006842 [Kappamyces sp. JEL0680]